MSKPESSRFYDSIRSRQSICNKTKKSVASTEFWEEQEKMILLAKTRSACSRFVNHTIQEQVPRESSNNDNGSSSSSDDDNNNSTGNSNTATVVVVVMLVVAGISNNNNNNNSIKNDDSGSSTPMEEHDAPFMIYFNNIDNMSLLITHYSLLKKMQFLYHMRWDAGKLLKLTASMDSGSKAKWHRRDSQSLPRNKINNMDKLEEVELQSTYCDPLLSELVVDQD
ncbi:hypothetical protein BDC45DRAFT_563911 [Circinella umbellata]|nr:hypothetical protein BDC45DRAFT_563911 [Circinella umbellata]